MKVQHNESRPFEALLHTLPEAKILSAEGGLPSISGIHRDSRQVSQGSLFALMPGLNGRSEAYCRDAIERGASAILTEHPVAVDNPSTLQVLVPNVRRALALLANDWYGYPSTALQLIGITGTNGKTTTSFIVQQILQQAGIRTGIIGTTGATFEAKTVQTGFTTPEAPELCSLLATMRDEGAAAVVMEVSSHGLALDRVYGQRFSGAVFTNLTQDHLDFHGTMEAYAEAKSLLFGLLSLSGTAVINGDSPYHRQMEDKSSSRHTYLYGRGEHNDIRLLGEECSAGSSSMYLAFGKRIPAHKQDYFSITTPLIGKFNLENVAAAVTIALSMGVEARLIQEALTNATGAPGRMQRFSLPNGAVAVVDYAHTPDALEKALQSCRGLIPADSTAKLKVVFGCGGNRDSLKRPIMGAIAASLADEVVLTDDNPRHENPDAIISDIYAGIGTEQRGRVSVVNDRATAIASTLREASGGDIILVAGKGHETYQIIGDTTLYFDDAEQVRSAF